MCIHWDYHQYPNQRFLKKFNWAVRMKIFYKYFQQLNVEQKKFMKMSTSAEIIQLVSHTFLSNLAIVNLNLFNTEYCWVDFILTHPDRLYFWEPHKGIRPSRRYWRWRRCTGREWGTWDPSSPFGLFHHMPFSYAALVAWYCPLRTKF